MKKKLVLILTIMALVETFLMGCSGTDAKKDAKELATKLKEEATKLFEESKTRIVEMLNI